MIKARYITMAVMAGQALWSVPVHASSVLEEVIVTAQKREQNLNDVGVSVSAFNGNQLKELGITDTTDLQAFTPGMVYTENGGAPAPAIFAIRGISQSDFSDHQEGPNALYTDGAYVSFTGAVGLSMYDVERVEVLRGPQGTLFGRNATGGLLHVISKKPTENFEAYIDVTAGEYSTFNTEGVVNGALTDAVNARLSFATNHSDGWFRNGGGDRKGIEDRNYNLRLQFDVELSDTTTLLLNLRGTKDDKAGAGKNDAILAYETDEGEVINQQSDQFVFADYQNWCSDFFGSQGGSPTQDCFGEQLNPDPYAENTDTGIFDREYMGSTITLTTSLGDGSLELTSITDFQSLEKLYIEDADKTELTTGTYDPVQDSHQFSQEINLSENDGDFRWQTGLYYLNISGDYFATFGGDDALFLSSSDYSLDTVTYAAFIQTEWDLSEELMLLTGYRLTRDEKDLRFSGTCIQYFDDPDVAGLCSEADFFASENPLQEIQGFKDQIGDTDYAYKVELDWRPADETLLYGSITRGNKGGGYSVSVYVDAPSDQVAFNPEVILSYEIGLKQTLFEGSAQFNASTFYYDYKDHQAQTFDGQAVTILNVDAAVKGFDAEFKADLGNSWTLMTGVAYLDAVAKDVPLGDRSASQELGLSPELSANAMIRKSWDLSQGNLSLQVQSSYFDERYLSVVNEQVTLIDDYTRTDASLNFASLDESWSVSLFVKNVTDGLHNTYKFNEFETNGTASVSYDTPRFYGVSVRKSWQ